jgi:hypothetical protein
MIAKYLIPIVAVISLGGGTFFGAKVLAPKPVDYDKIRQMIQQETAKIKPTCPDAVSLQTFDLSKLNNKKGNFSYAPQLHDVTIQLNCSDSTFARELLKKAR